jgi:putative transposase
MCFCIHAEAQLSIAWRLSSSRDFTPCHRHDRLILDILHYWWRRKSKGQARKPRIAEETITLIKQMAVENRRWGTKRIRGELLKLGIRVNRGTIRRYMWQARRKLPPQHYGQSWATFLTNHASEVWACDFVQTYDLFFRTVFLFFVIEHGSRRVVHVGVTRTPTDEWAAQQIRNATPFGEGPRFLICDNDDKYGACFEHAVEGAGIEIIHTPPYAPQANAICERFIGSVRRECLDHILILSEKHVRRVIREYCEFFNRWCCRTWGKSQKEGLRNQLGSNLWHAHGVLEYHPQAYFQVCSNLK